MTIPDAPSLRLTTAMTLEAWVYPTSVTSAWRDVALSRANDNYYLMASSRSRGPTGRRRIFSGSYGDDLRDLTPPCQYRGRTWRRPTTGRRCGCTSTASRSRARRRPGRSHLDRTRSRSAATRFYGQYFTGRSTRCASTRARSARRRCRRTWRADRRNSGATCGRNAVGP